jgi:hypothetical protein
MENWKPQANYVCAWHNNDDKGYSGGSKIKMDDNCWHVCNSDSGEWDKNPGQLDEQSKRQKPLLNMVCTYQKSSESSTFNYSIGSILRQDDGQLYVCTEDDWQPFNGNTCTEETL